MSVPRVGSLPLPVLRRLIDRIHSLGIRVVAQDEDPRPLESFHGDGCFFHRGCLYFHPRWTNVDLLVHEAGHAAQLTAEEAAAWDDDDMPTSEHITMALQLRLLKGIHGLGIRRGLRFMNALGYTLGATDRDVSAEWWWRRYADRTIRLEDYAVKRRGARPGRPGAPTPERSTTK